MLSVLCQYNYCCLYIPNTRTKSHHQIILPSVLFLILLITATISLPISPHYPSVVTQFHQVHCHSENYYELVSGHAVFLQCLKYKYLHNKLARQHFKAVHFDTKIQGILIKHCFDTKIQGILIKHCFAHDGIQCVWECAPSPGKFETLDVNLLQNLNCDAWPIEYRLHNLNLSISMTLGINQGKEGLSFAPPILIL